MVINLVVALGSEADPLVRHFGMSRDRKAGECGFHVYRGNDMHLVVTGVGKLNAAGGTAYLGGRNPGSGQAWLNVGLAGHRCLTPGTGTVALKITDRSNNRSWFPPRIDNLPDIGVHVMTYDHATTDYPPSTVCEMEAAAFYSIAIRFCSVELVQCYKVISDNAATGIAGVSPALAQQLIGDNLQHIDGLVSQLSVLAREASRPVLHGGQK